MLTRCLPLEKAVVLLWDLSKQVLVLVRVLGWALFLTMDTVLLLGRPFAL